MTDHPEDYQSGDNADDDYDDGGGDAHRHFYHRFQTLAQIAEYQKHLAKQLQYYNYELNKRPNIL
ncbi:hypothetical protein HK100_006765 [Physocladia obscura]|uniref:Uncharacterized protein n=1 Tax=Physocladia obscura TaxID=109957 RepID=A0AAD5SSQ1_9FUNG|nr:hypothetical protein HK100_006765 [Physocladia obscura]